MYPARHAGSALLAVVVTLTTAACGGTSVSQMTGPDPVRCDVTLSAASASVPAAGSQLNVEVQTARDCTWTARSQASWIQVSPTSGQGEATLALNVSANTAQDTRSGTVTVADQQYQVNQDAAAAPPPPPPPPPPPNCTYSLTPLSRTISENGGTRDVRVNTASACPWTATSSADWITVLDPSGSGTATIRYRVDRNRSNDPRIGTITVAGQVHVVLQSGD